MNVVSNGLTSAAEFIDDFEWLAEARKHPSLPLNVTLFVESAVHVEEIAELADTHVLRNQELTWTVIPRGSVELRITHVAEVTR